MKLGIAALLFAALTAAILSFKVERYEKLEDGVVVRFEKEGDMGLRSLRIQVLSDKIFRVTATPADSFSRAKSLMAVEKKRTPSWEVKEDHDEIVISTHSIRAMVSLRTGEVKFIDSLGNMILQENKGGGKSFARAEEEDDGEAFKVRQVFESPDNEGFYGLGQHQNDVMNYKGKDVDLTQYNSVAVVPFILSTRNYGILWDNYSISRFGDYRAYQPLSGAKLFSNDGVPGGLTATYATRKEPHQPFLVRQESVIGYEHLGSLKNFPEGFDIGKGWVKWEGTFEPEISGQYKFSALAAGYVKIWIDNKLVLDKWRQCWNPNTNLFDVPVEKGKHYPVRIEWIPDGGQSFLCLKFLSPLPVAEQNKLSLYSEVGDGIDYYFIHGKNADEVISGYREVTGKSPLLPKWAMGLWQSRERYKTQDEIISTVEQFRKRKIPLDNIVLDWQYWKEDQWGSHEFDATRFPDPAAMIRDLHQKYHAHFMISVWPKFYEGIDNYKLFNSKGWLYKENVKNRQRDWVGQGYVSTFYDAFNPNARKMFWDIMNKELYTKGVDAWWMDATEPDILSNSSIKERKMLMNPTALGPASRYFNGFSIVSSQGIYEGQRKANLNDRVFILTRSAYAGLQRFAAGTWSGDIGATWADMKTQISAGINFSMSGIPHWGMDIGGFAVENRFYNAKGEDLTEWREQMTRWFQFGSFVPLFRVHGQYPYREIFNTAPEDHPAYKSMLYYDRLRYRLMPYLYSLEGKTFHADYTIMRGLVMDFQDDENVKDIGDQYMFGPSLMINPVYQYKATHRDVYLPARTGWYDLYSGNYFGGGQRVSAPAPYERMPVFVKEGAIIPIGPEIQYTDEKKADPITLVVYRGKNGSFTLYEDEGVNYNYEKGQFATIPVLYDEKSGTLTIGERKGEFPGMLRERTFYLKGVNKSRPIGVDDLSVPDREVRYTGTTLTIQLDKN